VIKRHDSPTLLRDPGTRGCELHARKGEGSNLPFPDGRRQPDVAPVMLNKRLPSGIHPRSSAESSSNVTAAASIRRDGSIVADSTRVRRDLQLQRAGFGCDE